MALKKRQVFFLSLNIAFIAAVIAFAVYSWVSKPVSIMLHGSRSATESSTLLYSVNLTPVNQSDSFVSFNRPEGLTLRNTSLSSANSVAGFYYTARDIYSWTLAIDIASAPGGQIDETSAYQYRVANPSQYIEQSDIIKGQSIIIFTDNTFGGFDKVAFMSSGSLVATISLIGDDSSGISPLSQTFNMVLTSWHWL